MIWFPDDTKTLRRLRQNKFKLFYHWIRCFVAFFNGTHYINLWKLRNLNITKKKKFLNLLISFKDLIEWVDSFKFRLCRRFRFGLTWFYFALLSLSLKAVEPFWQRDFFIVLDYEMNFKMKDNYVSIGI